MHPEDDKRWEKTLIFALNAERMEQHTDVTETAKNQMMEKEGGDRGGGGGGGRGGGAGVGEMRVNGEPDKAG